MRFSSLCALLALALSAAPALAQKKKKPAKKTNVIQGDPDGGADSVEGWIIRKDKDGKIIKIPKKQTFKFGGSSVDGAVTRPAESSLSPRQGPPMTSLLPVRKSFRREFMDNAGAAPGAAGKGQ